MSLAKILKEMGRSASEMRSLKTYLSMAVRFGFDEYELKNEVTNMKASYRVEQQKHRQSQYLYLQYLNKFITSKPGLKSMFGMDLPTHSFDTTLSVEPIKQTIKQTAKQAV